MQKFSEAPDRKRDDAYIKRNPLGKKKETCSFFSSRRRRVNTLISLATSGKPRDRFKAARWLTCPQVATIYFTNDPQLKTPNNGLIKITTEKPYNGLNNY